MKKQQTAPRWLWLLLSLSIFAYLGSIVLPMVHCHYYGKETVAVIADFSTRMEGADIGPDGSASRVHYYTLDFDGHRIQKRTSGKSGKKIGDRLPVIYFADNPDSAVRGSRANGLWQTIKLSTNETNLAIASGVGLFFLLAAAVKPRPKLGLFEVANPRPTSTRS